jgi:tripeptide aminopeptidase
VRIVAGEPELRRLNDSFAALCRIESPSGRERACAEHVRAELRSLGVEVHEDGARPLTGSECGNLLARIPARPGSTAAGLKPEPPQGEGADGDGRPSLLLCAHLDTVPLAAPVEPLIVDGGWENANDGILGADNKAAVAVLLALARRAVQAGAPLDLELLFTVCEETSLAGARAFDVTRLRSRFGYVFDHASPIGEVVVAAPTHYRIDAAFHGAAAHAGIRPEDGRSAIAAAARAIATLPLGRLDEQTTTNVGTIIGGTAINVVPERCSFVAEARSLEAARAEAVVAEIVDRIHDAANLPDCECDVDVGVERMFTGYRIPASAPAVAVAEAALRACGYTPTRIASGGASDANAFQAAGLTVVNIANGTERNHESTERVSVAALQEMLDITLTLVHEAAGV